jgi:hypothetical protein
MFVQVVKENNCYLICPSVQLIHCKYMFFFDFCSQGSKDGLCPLDKLESTRKKMTCKNKLHVVDGGDHSLKIGKNAKSLPE